MLGTSGFFALKASGIDDDLSGLDANQGDRWSADEDERFDDGEAAANTAQGLAIVGGIAVVSGTVLYLLGRGGDKKAPQESLSISPSLGSAGHGLAISGRF
jgi:hypothetical protein